MRPMPAEKPINAVLVDSSRSKDSRIPYAIDPVVVVDHHGRSDVEETEDTFVWVDETAGSACTLVAETLSEITPEKWEFKPDLALMLALGIYTDTQSNTRAGDRDNQAFAWVKRYASATDLAALVNFKRQFSFMKNLARAVQYIERYDTYRQGRILGGLGRIPEKQGDDLAMVADELLRTVGAPLAVTWAVVETKSATTGEVVSKIRVCARSEDYTTNLSEALRTRFGDKSGAKILPDGSAAGGALFEFPGIGPWVAEVEMEDIIHRRIMEWFFDGEEVPSNTE
jgi:nanoRNase/pAp phosphatase (c-di-AMP/oligoRNAs hydrolase)